MWDKYDKIWDVIRNKLNIKFHSEPVYEYKYLKAKVREFNGVIKTKFGMPKKWYTKIMVCQNKISQNNGMPKQNMHYSCIACITIDSVITFNKKNHP